MLTVLWDFLEGDKKERIIYLRNEVAPAYVPPVCQECDAHKEACVPTTERHDCINIVFKSASYQICSI